MVAGGSKMPTNNKTANLGLNSWLGTDKPIREDFVSDNEKLDKVISDHLNDIDAHMTAERLELLNSSFVVGKYTGDGNSVKVISLDFQPRIAIVLYRGMPLVEYNAEGDYMVCNATILTSAGEGGSIGGTILSKTIRVSQTSSTSTGKIVNLNRLNGVYIYIAIK